MNNRTICHHYSDSELTMRSKKKKRVKIKNQKLALHS